MKTTLELPDDLVVAVEEAAAKRQTTITALVEDALRKEVSPGKPKEGEANEFIVWDENGMAALKPRGVVVTSEMIYKMLEEED